MNVVNYRVSLNMLDTLSQATIKAKKGDSACKIHITLTKNGKIFKIGEGCHATFNAKKADGNFVYDNCTIEGDTIVYDFSSSVDENGACQISAVEGNVDCETTLYNAKGEQLTSPRFTLYIDSVVYNGEEIASSPESDVLRGLITEARDTIEEMEDLIAEGGGGSGGGGGTVTDKQVATAVESYLEKNPVVGTPGDDGISPTVAVSKSGKVTTVSITDKDGTKTATINDGADGINGRDGYSIFEFFGENYVFDGNKFSGDIFAVSNYGCEVKIGDWLIFDTIFMRITSVEGGSVDATVICDLEGTPNLNGYATEKYVDDAIANIDIPEPDLGDYVESVNGKTGVVALSASDVGARSDTWTPTYTEVGADKSGTASSAVSTHNANASAHNDIRLLIEGLTARLNAIANSTDEDLDQMAEIVAYIKSNKTLIDSITTSKVSVADIVNNLTTNVSNKPLSAAQGVALKALIDAITVPTKVSELTNDAGYLKSYTETDPTVPSWAKAESKPSYTKSEVGLANVDNVKQYSASNPPPYPVTSVNGKTGAVTVAVPSKTSELTNDSGFLTQHQSLTDYAKKSEIPTKTSQLTNDSNFLTQHQSLSGYAKTADHYTKTESDNKYQPKGNYLTSHQDISGKADKSSAETWTFELEDGTTVTKKVVLA